MRECIPEQIWYFYHFGWYFYCFRRYFGLNQVYFDVFSGYFCLYAEIFSRSKTGYVKNQMTLFIFRDVPFKKIRSSDLCLQTGAMSGFAGTEGHRSDLFESFSENLNAISRFDGWIYIISHAEDRLWVRNSESVFGKTFGRTIVPEFFGTGYTEMLWTDSVIKCEARMKKFIRVWG